MGLYFSHPASLAHDTGAHPESARRIVAVEAALAARDWLGMRRLSAPLASREQLERAHAPEHVRAIAALCEAGGGMIDADTVASPGSWEAAQRAAGGACEAVERLLAGEAFFAVCALRPPGHHAERERAMGFCLFNNVAVAAEHALAAGARRVLIVDWDVHHGNGTEQIFRASREVLYASIHQAPLYPGTGPASYEGEGEGHGYTVNLPVPPGAGADEFLALLQQVIAPIARSFRPELVAISAGFDAHRDDPLASCLLDATAYGEMAAAIRELAGELEAPVLVCLEGGYELDALASSVVASVRGLTAGPPPRVAPLAAAAPHRERLAARWGL